MSKFSKYNLKHLWQMVMIDYSHKLRQTTISELVHLVITDGE